EDQHNHELVKNIATLVSSYRRFIPEMCDDIKLLAACGVRPGTIVEVLQHKNSEKYIHDKNVYNLVSSIRRHQIHSKSDASSMYLDLMIQWQENLTFHVDAQFEGQDNHLIRLCCMNSSQQELWSRFHNIPLLDTTLRLLEITADGQR
ncbi:10638_t:CDS:2, partial [Diversispora eburnea]